MNAIPGWQYFEEGEFVENAIQDIRDMAKRDRNHPSVVFWENSLNESGMTEEFMERANKVLKAELPLMIPLLPVGLTTFL
jgi:beta-galactosidase